MFDVGSPNFLDSGIHYEITNILKLSILSMSHPIKRATTLVHKAAMEIAVFSVDSFARHFHNDYRLQIHTDGTLDDADHARLMNAATSNRMKTEIITPTDRKALVELRLVNFPLTRRLLSRGGYFTKLEMPVYMDPPYFYFDSDIIWLRPVVNLAPHDGCNAFSTETWSWYHGVCHDSKWIANGTPRRVNSGFYHLGTEFPFNQMEKMLEMRMFDAEKPLNTDQEIFAYLYPKMMYYHIDEMKRSRVGSIYRLSSESSAALHFPGGMWRAHMDQIKTLADEKAERTAMEIRYTPSVPLRHCELWRMRAYIALSKSRILRTPLYLFRDIRKVMVSLFSKQIG